VSRVDKYEPLSGGSRAALGFTLATNQVNVVLGVGLDTSGRLQLGAANTGIIGVICLEKIHTTGQIVDVMVRTATSSNSPGVAGTNYFADGVSGAFVAGTGARDRHWHRPLPTPRRSDSRSRQPQGWLVSWSASAERERRYHRESTHHQSADGSGSSSSRHSPTNVSDQALHVREGPARPRRVSSASAGGARGTNAGGDIVTQTADGRDLNDLWAEFQSTTVQAQNAERQRLVDLLTFTGQNMRPRSAAVQFGRLRGRVGVRRAEGHPSHAGRVLARVRLRVVRHRGSLHLEVPRGSGCGSGGSRSTRAVLEADNRNVVYQPVMRTMFNNANSTATINGQPYNGVSRSTMATGLCLRSTRVTCSTGPTSTT
jgi:hypothetical protein